MIPTDLVFTGIVLALVAGLGAVSYSGYHRRQIRDRFTAEGYYHNERAQLGDKALVIACALPVVLVMLLGVSR